MNIKNVIALSAMLVVGYVTYTMQQPAESSAMAAARGAGREAPSLKQMAATKIARMLHDGEMTIDLTNMPEDPQERMIALNKFFHRQEKAIADAYYRLYPDEFPKSLIETQKIDDYASFLTRLSDGSFIINVGSRSSEIIQRWRLQPDGTFVSSEELNVERKTDIADHSMAVSLDGNLICLGPELPLMVYARDAHGKFARLQAINGDTAWSVISRCAVYSDTVGKTLMVKYYSREREKKLLDIYDWSPEINRFEKVQEMLEDAWGIQFIDNNSFIAAARDRVTVWARNAIGEQFTLRETFSTGKITRSGYTALSLDKRVFAWSSESDEKRISILERDNQNHFILKQEIQGNSRSNLYLSANGRTLIIGKGGSVEIWISDSQGHFSHVNTLGRPGDILSVAILAGEQEDYLVVSGISGINIYKRLHLSLRNIWNHILDGQKAFQD
jgi:hypothetical protein